MQWSHIILGRLAFRKCFSTESSARLRPVNKALFEAWSVNLDRLSDEELQFLGHCKSDLLQRFVALMGDRSFEQSISQGTGDVGKVKFRFAAIRKIIGETLF